MMNQNEKTPTPKELYDEQMKVIKDEKLKANDSSLKEDAELDEQAERIIEGMEKAEKVKIDKSMGDVKIPQQKMMTHEEWTKFQNAQLKQKSIESYEKIKAAKQEVLSKEQREVVETVLKKVTKGQLQNAIVKHLVNEKINLQNEYHEKQVRVNQLNTELLNKLCVLTGDVLKVKTNMDFLDKEILKLVQKNPNWIE